jgi:hypothetical protein
LGSEWGAERAKDVYGGERTDGDNSDPGFNHGHRTPSWRSCWSAASAQPRFAAGLAGLG